MDFKPFDRDAERHEYRRRLPHWTQPGCTYFITFRLGDAMPPERMRQWREERDVWLRTRGVASPQEVPRLSTEDQRLYHRHFTQKMHEWLDAGHGSCLLRAPEFARIVGDALLFFDGERGADLQSASTQPADAKPAPRCAIGDFVVMPNHVHLLATPLDDWPLKKLLQSWKRHSAREINKLRGAEGSLWLDESFDHTVRSAEQLAHFRRYIRENPAKARLGAGEYLLGCGSDRGADL